MLEPVKWLALVTLNGIPRGVAHDFNVEEGWIQYIIPTSENCEDYSNPKAKLELRRFYGKVEVLGYYDLYASEEEERDKFTRYYESIPEGTPHFPSKPYDVIQDLGYENS